MMTIAAYILIFILPILEGFREHRFYLINRAAKFQFRWADIERKKINALLFAGFLAPIAFMVEGSALQRLVFAAAIILWRWIALDGILNHLRNLGFFYAGNSGRSLTDRILYPLPIWGRAIVKLLPMLMAVFSYLYLNEIIAVIINLFHTLKALFYG